MVPRWTACHSAARGVREALWLSAKVTGENPVTSSWFKKEFSHVGTKHNPRQRHRSSKTHTLHSCQGQSDAAERFSFLRNGCRSSPELAQLFFVKPSTLARRSHGLVFSIVQPYGCVARLLHNTRVVNSPTLAIGSVMPAQANWTNAPPPA